MTARVSWMMALVRGVTRFTSAPLCNFVGFDFLCRPGLTFIDYKQLVSQTATYVRQSKTGKDSEGIQEPPAIFTGQLSRKGLVQGSWRCFGAIGA